MMMMMRGGMVRAARCGDALARRGGVMMAVVVGQKESVGHSAGEAGVRDEIRRNLSQESCAAMTSRRYTCQLDVRFRSGGIGCGNSTAGVWWMRSMSAASAAKKSKRQKQRATSHDDDDSDLDTNAADGGSGGDDGFGATDSLAAIMPRLESKVEDAVDAMDERLRQLRTGIAHPSLLSHIVVECYGTTMSIQDVAAVSVSDKRVLSVNVFDASVVKVRCESMCMPHPATTDADNLRCIPIILLFPYRALLPHMYTADGLTCVIICLWIDRSMCVCTLLISSLLRVTQNVESAIMKANLGLQPIVGGGSDDGSGSGGAVIRVPVPVLDSDGKKELLKVVSKIGETTKVQIRGHRKDAMQVRSDNG